MSRRPDGLLNHNVLDADKGPQDACGVFGVWAPGEEVAKLTFYGLYALQHRGQESAGIATSDGERILVYKDMGLVSQVFTETDLASLVGNLAIGHCRYSTTGSSTWVNAQPTLRPTKYGTLALAHNGNLTNTGDLAELVQKLDADTPKNTRGATTDTEIMTALIGLQDEKNVEASASASGDHTGRTGRAGPHRNPDGTQECSGQAVPRTLPDGGGRPGDPHRCPQEIGRASCRERV